MRLNKCLCVKDIDTISFRLRNIVYKHDGNRVTYCRSEKLITPGTSPHVTCLQHVTVMFMVQLKLLSLSCYLQQFVIN